MIIKTENPIIYSSAEGDDEGFFSKLKAKRKKKKMDKKSQADYDKEKAKIYAANKGTDQRLVDAAKGKSDVNLANLKTKAAEAKLKYSTSSGAKAIEIVETKEGNQKKILIGAGVLFGLGLLIYFIKKKK